MMAGIGVERLQSPVVEDEQVDAREACQPYRNTPVAARHAQFVKQLAKPDVEDRQIVAAGLVPNGTGQPALARSGWAGDDEIVVTFDPVTLEKGFHKAPVEPARCPIVDLFWAGRTEERRGGKGLGRQGKVRG